MSRLVAIGLVWIGCSLAWVILGATLVHRTGEATGSLGEQVHALWGPPLRQPPPHPSYEIREQVREVITRHDAVGVPVETIVTREVVREVPADLTASDIQVRLSLRQRKKGLMWFPTYTVDFEGHFTIANPDSTPHRIDVRLPLAGHGGAGAIYDGFRVLDADGAAVPVVVASGKAQFGDRFGPNESRRYTIAYRSRGTTSWHYGLTEQTGQARDFRLRMTTDFRAVDFPAGTLSPTRHARSARGWSGEWAFRSLVANASIGMGLPGLVNPGPLASRITFFAPVGLLFFVFVVAIFGAARQRNLHPMNYFLLGCAFFAFHLLFAYLIDHLEIAPAFVIASAVSVALIASYARLFVGWRFALATIVPAQLLYLVLFSVTFFWKGYTGLSITAGAILTLLVVMQLTGRVDWNERFAVRSNATVDSTRPVT